MATGTIAKPYEIHTFNYGKSDFSATSAWKYTGLTVTIPANCAFVIQGTGWYNGSRPEALAICTSSTSINAQVSNGANNGASATVTYAGYIASQSTTYYLWAKYGSDATNSVNISGWYIHI